MNRSWWSMAAAGCVLCAVAAPAQGQKGRPLNVTGAQSLAFGTIFGGVLAFVPRTDAARVGQFQVTGAKGTQVRVTFTLPAALSLGGQTVPVQFAAGDGGVSASGTIGTATAFDPRVPLTATLSQQGRLYLYLGGTALAGLRAPAGTYAADITVNACYVGVPPC